MGVQVFRVPGFPRGLQLCFVARLEKFIEGFHVRIPSHGRQGRLIERRVRKTSCCFFFSLALKSGPLVPIWGACQLPGKSIPKSSRNHVPARIVTPKEPLGCGIVRQLFLLGFPLLHRMRPQAGRTRRPSCLRHRPGLSPGGSRRGNRRS